MPFLTLSTTGATSIVATLGAPLTAGSGKTLAQLRLEVRLVLKRRTDITDAEIDGWINDAYRELTSTIEFEELRTELEFTSVVDQQKYLLPDGTDIVSRLSVRNTQLPAGGYELEKQTEDVLRRDADWLSDYPAKWLQKERLLVLWPPPDGAYTLVASVSYAPQKLTLTTHQPLIEPHWHYALSLKAQEIALAAIDQPEKSGEKLNKFLSVVRPKIEKRAKMTKGVIMRVSIPRRPSDLRRPRRYDDEPWR
jgi:hypothetical protein